MTYQHELECPCFPDFEWKECTCDSISRAYLRGRNDAAKGLTNWYLANGDEPLSEWESECVAAARGGGEQNA